MTEDTSDKNVEIWKVKKLIKSLMMARGNGTSMISLIIPPGDQVRVFGAHVILTIDHFFHGMSSGHET